MQQAENWYERLLRRHAEREARNAAEESLFRGLQIVCVVICFLISWFIHWLRTGKELKTEDDLMPVLAGAGIIFILVQSLFVFLAYVFTITALIVLPLYGLWQCIRKCRN